MKGQREYIRWFDELDSSDKELVGGKNASLGELITSLKRIGIKIPDGFATTAAAYQRFLDESNIRDKIDSHLGKIKKSGSNLSSRAKAIRGLIKNTDFPERLIKEIKESYRELGNIYSEDELDVAVRSSATAEDLPGASFAGQQETFLNISGDDDLLRACKKCYMSLFTDRAISYREEKGFEHMKVSLSIGVQKMVRSDKAGSGVMFSIDTETGFPDAVVINASWGLGENVVQGTVNPDEYVVFKPLLGNDGFKPILEKNLGRKKKKMVYARGGSKTTRNISTAVKLQKKFVLNDDEILKLARWATAIENHYQRPMDIEWAKDGESGDLFIVQARPETVQSRRGSDVLKSFKLNEKGKKILSGISIGQSIASGKAQLIRSADAIDKFKDGSILVTKMTDPDWVPIMKKAEGIITDFGGRTSHAAIVSRELGIPAVVGTENGTRTLKNGQEITLSCAEGDEGHIYNGILDYDVSEMDLEEIPEIKTKILMNIATPAAAFRWWKLPVHGIGLARMEFIINNIIKIHPMALLNYGDIEDSTAKKKIEKITESYKNKKDYFIDHLSMGIARIAASRFPDKVIVRLSDFKSNEYANLIGGEQFEPDEENPMLGFRGACRYYSEQYRDAFSLECEAIKKARNEIGLSNIVIMIPFCRTPAEADRTLEALAENELVRGKDGLEIYVMCEVPSNIILAEEFSKRFDGFSIGSNDLTQLVLGVDRDSELLKGLFDERDQAVKDMIATLIQIAHRENCQVGICGQAPSDYPDFAGFLVKNGIDTISLNPDSVIEVINRLSKME